ncbi:MAG: phosphatase PAP2 family protein [Clostridia bacterium]|nr:phosphatase PAP2 family protein [Clostridia bacterium]
MNFIESIDLFFGEIWNAVAQNANHILSPLCQKITFIGEYGILYFAIAIVLMAFRKTRKVGVMVFGALCFGTLFTNIILKNAIGRPRPFTTYPYAEWWAQAGSVAESGYSFPSGHVTAITAFFVALIINKGYRKFIPLAVVCVGAMCVARNYLMAHYATDIIAGVLVGSLGAVCSLFATKGIYFLLEKYKEKKFCAFCLNFSLAEQVSKIFSQKSTLSQEELAENLQKEENETTQNGEEIQE